MWSRYIELVAVLVFSLCIFSSLAQLQCEEGKAFCAVSYSGDMMVSAIPGKTRADFVAFELEGVVHNNTHYLAMGLSTDQRMGDDSVVACKLEGQKGDASQYWNTAHPYYSTILSDPHSGLNTADTLVSMEDSLMKCRFSLSSNSTLSTPTSPSRNVTVDLSTGYYVLLAKGPLNDAGLVAPHKEVWVSQNKTVFAPATL